MRFAKAFDQVKVNENRADNSASRCQKAVIQAHCVTRRDLRSKRHERLTVVERVRVKLGFSFAQMYHGAHRQFNDLANSDELFHY